MSTDERSYDGNDSKLPALYTPDEARAAPAPALRAFMEGRDHEEAP